MYYIGIEIIADTEAFNGHVLKDYLATAVEFINLKTAEFTRDNIKDKANNEKN